MINFMFMHQELMFAVHEHVFIARELMFMHREHNFLREQRYFETKERSSAKRSRILLVGMSDSLELILQHHEGIGCDVEGELLLGFDLLLLRSDGLYLVVVLVVGLTCERGLRSHLLDAETAQVDIGFLSLIAGVTDLHEELACLGVQDHTLTVVHVLHGLDGIGGITLELHAVAIPVVT